MKISLRHEKKEFLVNAPAMSIDIREEKRDVLPGTGIKTVHL